MQLRHRPYPKTQRPADQPTETQSTIHAAQTIEIIERRNNEQMSRTNILEPRREKINHRRPKHRHGKKKPTSRPTYRIEIDQQNQVINHCDRDGNR